MKQATIGQVERRTIIQSLRKQGFDVNSNAGVEALSTLVSAYYKQEPPTVSERLALLTRFLEGINQALRPGRVPPRDPPVFRPLKVSKAMLEQLERCKEVHPDVLELQVGRW